MYPYDIMIKLVQKRFSGAIKPVTNFQWARTKCTEDLQGNKNGGENFSILAAKRKIRAQ